MKETNRARPMKAVRSEVGSRPIIVNTLVMLLCFVSGVTGKGFLFEGNFRVRASSYKQNRMETLSPPTMSLPGLISFGHAPAKFGPSDDHVWRESRSRGKRKSIAKYRELSLNAIAQREVLRHAPMEFSKAARQTQVVMTLPMPDGTLCRFRIEESPVMEPQLAAFFPKIKTYRGQGLDDPTATTRFDVTPAGFHAIVLSSQGTSIIEPASLTSRGQYISYNQSDAPEDVSSFSCLLLGAEQAQAQSNQTLLKSTNPTLAIGATLRTYRLALAATAEFTQTYGGGTVGGSLNALTTLINGVNAIYERDLAIHLTLIGNETSIIFTNSATDPYTSDNAITLLSQNQSVLDQRIGPSNYDIGFVLDGHVYAFQPGKFLFEGAGQFQSVCVNGQKGKGVTILRSIDPSTTSAIWDVAHEFGHMFGALHTFNGTTEDCAPPSGRFAQTAYETGSGSTIMGFRGGTAPNGTYLPLCTFEDLRSTDTYFHSTSIEQIVNYTSFGSGGSCPTLTNTGNNPPIVDAGPDFTIPSRTPFTLTATASDPEADALTYCWEEYDLGAAGPPHTDNGNRPIFRSFAPVPNPTRTFPQLSDILSNASTFGESLPTTSRTMTFRVTVRDNHAGSGGVNTGAMHVNVVSSSGPFMVTQPGGAASWAAGSTQSVTWNVANTSSGPINCASVRVLLSLDGGNTFPFILAAGIPNTGAAMVNVPNLPTSAARLKVEAVDNIFFNISPANFTITPSATSPPSLLTEANTNRAIALDSVTFMRDSFSVFNLFNLSSDQRTRVMLFAIGLELMPGENISVVTAQAEDSAHRIYPLTVEHVGKVPNFDWLTQVNIRLADGLAGAGDVLVSVSVRGAVSNKVIVGIQ